MLLTVHALTCQMLDVKIEVKITHCVHKFPGCGSA